jgi:hypothetical protein
MELKIDETVVQQAVSAALMEQLGTDGQRTLVTAALQYLITPPKSRYGAFERESPLQEAFNAAVGNVARQMVQEMVDKNEEFKHTIRTQVGAAFIKMEAKDFTNHLGHALSDALKASAND